MTSAAKGDRATQAAGVVLLTLSAGQFLMALDSSVMNVSIATVAKDLDTTITGIQTAIVLYTLVMAMLMVTGGKIGSIIGRKRAFVIGLVIYCSGSLTTALAPNLGVLIFGWSFLEGVGAALIMPAIVALVASNFPPEGRPRAYGLVGAAGAIAIAVGPLIGGLATTYASWRWVFAGEVIVGAGIFLFSRRVADEPVGVRPHLDVTGSILWALGMGLAVFAVLRSSTWGWLMPADGAPSLLGMSLVVWFVLGGLVSLRLFMGHVRRLDARGGEPLVTPSLFRNAQMTGGLVMFFFQFLVMMGVFYVIPLYLSVALGLSAIDTGIRLTPLSVMMLVAAVGIPKRFPAASPRRVVELGLGVVVLGIVVLFATMDADASAAIVTWPLLAIGVGMGALASQLGAVTVSAVPNEQSAEVGGLQNTATQFGASLGTALAGSILIASLTASFLSGIAQNPDVPKDISSQASVELDAGVPLVSDAQLETALQEADVPAKTAQAILDENQQARVDGLRAALALLAIIGFLGLFFTKRIPERQPGSPAGAPSTSGAG